MKTPSKWSSWPIKGTFHPPTNMSDHQHLTILWTWHYQLITDYFWLFPPWQLSPFNLNSSQLAPFPPFLPPITYLILSNSSNNNHHQHQWTQYHQLYTWYWSGIFLNTISTTSQHVSPWHTSTWSWLCIFCTNLHFSHTTTWAIFTKITIP